MSLRSSASTHTHTRTRASSMAASSTNGPSMKEDCITGCGKFAPFSPPGSLSSFACGANGEGGMACKEEQQECSYDKECCSYRCHMRGWKQCRYNGQCPSGLCKYEETMRTERENMRFTLHGPYQRCVCRVQCRHESVLSRRHHLLVRVSCVVQGGNDARDANTRTRIAYWFLLLLFFFFFFVSSSTSSSSSSSRLLVFPRLCI